MLKGRAYNVNTLSQLPEELNVFKVTTKENENTVGFFGEINPLSNFYPSTFLYDRIQYISSEQLIQQGSHSDWKTWKNGKAFSSQGKVREF